jgi:hypothetical protein
MTIAISRGHDLSTRVTARAGKAGGTNANTKLKFQSDQSMGAVTVQKDTSERDERELSMASIAGYLESAAPLASSRYWLGFCATLALLFLLTSWWVHSTGQDHIGAITLRGDSAWYYNYAPGFEIQDQDIFYHGIGQSIENARNADIIFLGWSKLLFGLDWRQFDAFAQKHQVKMFNMGFAGVESGEFARLIIHKFGLRPKLWIINADNDLHEAQAGFFSSSLSSGAGLPASTVLKYGSLWSYKNVIGRNIRWRLQRVHGSAKLWSYRSVKTGNWYLDDWPNHTHQNPPIKLRELHRTGPASVNVTERVNFSCPAIPEEVAAAQRYLTDIGGTAVLIQLPNQFSCAQRVQEMAKALEIPALTVDEIQFTTVDGGHLDSAGAQKYSKALFAWLEELPEFQRLFPH